MENAIIAVLVIAGLGLIFFPATIESSIYSGSYTYVSCQIGVERLINQAPALSSVSCTRTQSKCIDISPLAALGDYTASLALQMNGRTKAQSISVAFGLPVSSTSYELSICSPVNAYTGDVTLFGTSKEVLGQKTFTLT